MMFDNEEPYDEYGYGEKKNSLFNPYAIIIILGLAYFFLFFRDVEFTYNAFIVYSVLLLLGIGFVRGEEIEFRHKSPKVVMPGDSTTYRPGAVRYAGQYAIIPRCGVDVPGIGSWDGGGKNGAIIAPIACLNYMDQSVSVTAQGIPVPFEMLPESVQEKIPWMGIPRDAPFIFGLAAPEQYGETLDDDMLNKLGLSKDELSKIMDIKLSKPSLEFFSAVIRDQNKRISEQQRLINMKYQDIVRFTDVSAGTKERLKGMFFDEPKRQ